VSAPSLTLASPASPARLTRDAPLAPLTTLGLGGRARALIEVDSDASLLEALRFARESRVPIFVLGGGSNVVIADAGFPGVVVRMASRGVALEPDAHGAASATAEDRVRVRAAAGEPWDALVARTVAEGLVGIECLSGIPGLVGSTPIQNVGAYGQEVADTIVEVEVLDRDTLERATFAAAECRFGYRHSLFKEPVGASWIVTAVTFSLRRGAPGPVRYGELAKALAARGGVTTVREIREEVVALRRAKSMVWDPEDPNRRSAGSFFTNPVVTRALAERLIDDAVATGLVRYREEVPVFSAPEQHGVAHAKLSAGWLIERAGFERGLRRGAVGLSTKHALCLVHHGGGQAAELIALARDIADGVEARFGVRLVPEPVFVGFDRAF
jgi:UDP-N-acetylmuramate dehydrogenase